MRRKKSEDKMEIFERDIRRNLIITQVGGKTATEVLPSPSAHLMPNFYASDKTTSTRLVSSSCSTLMYINGGGIDYMKTSNGNICEINGTRLATWACQLVLSDWLGKPATVPLLFSVPLLTGLLELCPKQLI